MNSFPSKKKIKVNYFQRKPRKGFDFSLEFIFEDVRKRLAEKIDAKVYISRRYNDGYLSKFVNIFEAAFRAGDDVNHITGEIHFLDFLMKKEKVILTVLDCGMMNRKTGFAKKIVQWLYLSGPVKHARFVTAISQVTKEEIIEYTACNPDKIHVIPVAIRSDYRPFPKNFNKIKPSILHIGTGYNKNLLRLISAISGIECQLTIIGRLSDEHLEALKENKIEYNNEYNISNERLLEKYKECDILSFISTSEGFGMPIVEANTVERVVITSNVSSMPEIAGDAACLVDPYDLGDIRNGFRRIIDDADYRDSLIANGRKNKLRYDPDKIANSYYELYLKSLIDKPNRTPK